MPTPTWSSFELTRHLTVAMESRAVIEQAKGVLIAHHRITADEAFERLRHQSQSENRKLRVIAADIVHEFSESTDPQLSDATTAE